MPNPLHIYIKYIWFRLVGFYGIYSRRMTLALNNLQRLICFSKKKPTNHLHSPELQDWDLIIWLFNVINRTFVGGFFLSLCRDAVDVFYSHNWLSGLCNGCHWYNTKQHRMVRLQWKSSASLSLLLGPLGLVLPARISSMDQINPVKIYLHSIEILETI